MLLVSLGMAVLEMLLDVIANSNRLFVWLVMPQLVTILLLSTQHVRHYVVVLLLVSRKNIVLLSAKLVKFVVRDSRTTLLVMVAL